jgi:hypothetical protein
VSIEMVKIVQAFVFIGKDRDMYDPGSDTPAVARTSNLNEASARARAGRSRPRGLLARTASARGRGVWAFARDP